MTDMKPSAKDQPPTIGHLEFEVYSPTASVDVMFCFYALMKLQDKYGVDTVEQALKALDILNERRP